MRTWQYICRWLPSITILQLPQDKTEGAQSALIKWQFTRCKYLRILGRAFHKALPWPMRPRRAPAEFERRHRIISVFFGFDPEFVEEMFLLLVCFGWLPLTHTVAQCRSPSSGSCYDIRRYFLTWFFVFLSSLIVACCLVFVKTSLQACVAGCFHLLASMCGRLLSSSVAFFLCLLIWMKSFCTFVTFLLEIPRPFPNTKTKGKITCTATRTGRTRGNSWIRTTWNSDFFFLRGGGPELLLLLAPGGAELLQLLLGY